MDKKDKKQHQNLSLHERYLALLDKHNAENADKPPEEQEGPQIKNEVVKKALAAVHGPGKLSLDEQQGQLVLITSHNA